MIRYGVTAIRWGVYAALLTPLAVSPSTLYPLVVGKVVAFRVLVELLFALWITVSLADPARRPRGSWLSLSVLAYLGSLLLSTVFSLNPSRSFWSSAERMEGLATLLHYIAFFFIIAATFRSEPHTWRRFFRFSIGVSLTVSLVALVQWFRVPWPSPFPAQAGTVGHPSYLAIYLVFHMGFALYLAAETRRRLTRWGWVAVFVFEAFLVLATGSRGMVIGLAGAFLFALLTALIWPTLRPIRPYAFGLLFLLLVSASGLYLLRHSPLVLDTPPLARAASLFTFWKEATVKTRLLNWEAAARAVRDHPLFGWGLEMSYAAFFQYIDPTLMNIEEAFFDRPHNKVLELLLVSGIVGLLTYLSMFGALGWTLWRPATPESPLNRPATRLIFSALLLAYFVQNLFIFDHPSSYLMFFFTLGFLEASSKPPTAQEPAARPITLATSALPLTRIVVVLFIAAATAYGIFLNWRHFATTRLLREARDAPTLSQAFAALDRVTRTPTPFLMEIAIRVGEMTEGVQRRMAHPDPESLDKILDLGIVQLARAVEQDPSDLRGYTAMAALFVRKASLTGDSRFLDLADSVLDVALQRVRKLPTLYLDRGVVALARRDYAQAIRHGEEAIRLSPDFARAWWFLGLAYRLQGSDATAVAAIDRAFQLGYQKHWNSIRDLEQLSALYRDVKRYGETARFLTRLIELEPKNLSRYMILAAVYRETADYQRAREIAETLLAVLPTLTLPQEEKAAFERSAREFLSSLKK